eukprot:11542475-Karenia_brevis.AAC.1
MVVTWMMILWTRTRESQRVRAVGLPLMATCLNRMMRRIMEGKQARAVSLSPMGTCLNKVRRRRGIQFWRWTLQVAWARKPGKWMWILQGK